jgi:putative nucleotidyltransferase with HDIG domain
MATSRTKHRLFYKKLLYTALIIAGSLAVIVYFLPRGGKFNYQFDLNKPWRYGQLIATFNFPIYKDEAVIKKEQDSLRIHFQPYFNLHKDIATKELNDLSTTIQKKNLPAKYKTYIAEQLNIIYKYGVISNEDMNWLQTNRTISVLVTDNKIANEHTTNTLFTVKTAYQYLLQDSVHFNPNILQQCELNNFIIPNISLDRNRTRQAQQEMMDNYSWAVGFVQSGQKIIDRGEIVSQQTYNILESLRKESIRRNETMTQKKLILCGQILFVGILIFCFMLYLRLFRKNFFLKRNYMALMLSSIIFFCVITSLMVENNIFNVYIIPFAMIPIILRVFLDSRTAFLTLLITVFICSITLHYPYEFILLQLTAGLVSIYSLSELSQRSQLLRVAVFVTITYIITYFAIELIIENDLSKFNFTMYKYFIINGIFLLFAYPLLFLLEKLFGFTSNVTLVELSNTNNHLLRKMSELAPGTFQHSIQVANLAAAAANELGADSQLVRTGALYHDIGKIENPTFFIENQTENTNPHKDLSYEQSAQIVINHVKDGLKLAERYNLPSVIKDFIVTHHGCGKTKYFYISWKNEHPGKEADDRLFTYPGPNPFSKETAILMMADSVEAASHSLTIHTDDSINELVDRIIDAKVADGAFEECPITFRDIAEIKTIFKEKLRSIYHVRISYPELRGK